MHYRIKTLYGEMYEPSNITRKTMNNLYEIFGPGSTVSMAHFAKMTVAGHLVDANGKNVYLPQMSRLANLPMTLISGAKDGIWLPGSTEVAAKELRKAGCKNVARHVVHDYGHMDLIIGKDAAKDVWPIILQHLEAAHGNGKHIPVERGEHFKGVQRKDCPLVSLDVVADIVEHENQNAIQDVVDTRTWGGSGFTADDYIKPKAEDLVLEIDKPPEAPETKEAKPEDTEPKEVAAKQEEPPTQTKQEPAMPASKSAEATALVDEELNRTGDTPDTTDTANAAGAS
jgi:hypothetical protein